MKRKSKINNLNKCVLMVVFLMILYTFAISKLIVFNKTIYASTPEFWDGTTSSSFLDGNGTLTQPYLISNGKELAYLQSVVFNYTNDTINSGKFNQSDKYYKLTNNIYLNDIVNYESWSSYSSAADALASGVRSWTPIGNSSSIVIL